MLGALATSRRESHARTINNATFESNAPQNQASGVPKKGNTTRVAQSSSNQSTSLPALPRAGKQAKSDNRDTVLAPNVDYHETVLPDDTPE